LRIVVIPRCYGEAERAGKPLEASERAGVAERNPPSLVGRATVGRFTTGIATTMCSSISARFSRVHEHRQDRRHAGQCVADRVVELAPMP
jgi:hypothetical protein